MLGVDTPSVPMRDIFLHGEKMGEPPRPIVFRKCHENGGR